MDPLDFFIMEEFIFPEEGGVTGTVEVACPHCDSVWVLAPRCQWISCQSYVGPKVSLLTSGTELALASPSTRTCLCATLTCGILRPRSRHMCSSRSGGSQGRGEIDPTSADAMIPNPVRSYDSQLRHDALDHRPVHVGQTKLSTRVSISQPLVIKSQQMQ